MKIGRLFLIFLLLLSININVYGESDSYLITDSNSGFAQSYSTYNEAYAFYIDNTSNYDNLLLYKNSDIIMMEYGIVEFKDEDNIIEYYSTERNVADYICSSYGVDGAYLYTSNDGEKVYFKVAGDIGYTSINTVVLHPIESISFKPSSYATYDNCLYHNIETQLDIDYYTYSICLDNMPSFMANNNKYYSYDGNYFYNDFVEMIDDYRNDTYENAINEEPYYNYFQYLPMRSLTNYSVEEMEDYFYNTLGINCTLTHYRDLDGDGANDEVNKSMLYGNINEFFNCEAMYGVNALINIASSIVESSYGKNLNAYMHNNLYENAVYETEQEAQNQRYNNIAESIYTHSKYYISDKYSNYLKSSYTGTYLGNKKGGINIEYSLDHYYGEKVASECYKIDKALGNKDYNKNAICFIENIDSMYVYKDEQLQSRLFNLKNINEISFVILDETNYIYKIQVDPSFNDEYLYDFDKSIAYISKDIVDFVINNNNIHEYDLSTYNYDFGQGSYHDYSNLVIKSSSQLDIVPKYDGYEFVDYEDVEDYSYISNYRKIDSISIDYLLEKQGELLPYPNLDKAKIVVHYEDGKTKKVNVNNEMLSTYDPYDFDSQSISVTYNGVSVSKDIQIDGEYYDIKDRITNTLKDLDYSYVKDNMDIVDYHLTIPMIREIDDSLKQSNLRNYVINDKTEKYDISFSGLDLSLDDRRNFSLIEDTYYVDIKNISAVNRDKIFDVAKGYGFDVETGLNISFRFNYQKLNLRGPVVVQIDLDNKQIDKIYSVYHLDSSGNVIKCRTNQTKDYIQFMIEETGDYLLLSLPSFNTYDLVDKQENLNYNNMGFDNNRTNIEFLLGLFAIMLALVGILVYYKVLDKKDSEWKDYKKSLLKADIVHEEKLKN